MSYLFKFTLLHSNPPIWRRVIINPEISLHDLHKIIQTSMGWENSHLYAFSRNKKSYSFNEHESDFNNDEDSRFVKVKDIFKRARSYIFYNYDFGDDWEHKITFEQRLMEFEEAPLCIEGIGNCPPEDCGGIWQYKNILKVIKNRNHEDYPEIIDWLGEDFDPDYFDKDEINIALKEQNFGCPEFF